MGGMYVFPGGAVHAEDAAPEMRPYVACEPRPWSADDEPTETRAYAIAAVRETLEEAGILIGAVAPDRAGPLSVANPGDAAESRHAQMASSLEPDEAAEVLRAQGHVLRENEPPRSRGGVSGSTSEWRPSAGHAPAMNASLCDLPSEALQVGRARLHGGGSFAEVLAALDCRLDLSTLVPLSRWITPSRNPIRFDTRFYVARAPSNMDAIADGTESIALAWYSPARAIGEHRAKTLLLSPPTLCTIEEIAPLSSVNRLLEYAAGRRPPCIEP